jgi:hypothetical protein
MLDACQTGELEVVTLGVPSLAEFQEQPASVPSLAVPSPSEPISRKGPTSEMGVTSVLAMPLWGAEAVMARIATCQRLPSVGVPALGLKVGPDWKSWMD